MTYKFIICGASRSGKSVLAKRLKDRFNLNWIIGDAIVSSLEDAFPNIGISHHGDLDEIGDRLETYIKYLLWNYAYEGGGYVFDSTHLYPRHIERMREKLGEGLQVAFLGYAEADEQEKMAQIRRHDPAQDWWTAERTDDELKTHICAQISKSRIIRQECEQFGFPYIETSGDFEKAISLAEQHILAP